MGEETGGGGGARCNRLVWVWGQVRWVRMVIREVGGVTGSQVKMQLHNNK